MLESEQKRRTTLSMLQSACFSSGLSSTFNVERQPCPIAALRTISRRFCSLDDIVQRQRGNMNWFKQPYAIDIHDIERCKHKLERTSATVTNPTFLRNDNVSFYVYTMNGKDLMISVSCCPSKLLAMWGHTTCAIRKRQFEYCGMDMVEAGGKQMTYIFAT